MTLQVQTNPSQKFQFNAAPPEKIAFDAALNPQQKVSEDQVKEKLKQYAKETYYCQTSSDYWSTCKATKSAEDRCKEVDSGEFDVNDSEAQYLAKAFGAENKPNQKFAWLGFTTRDCSGWAAAKTGECGQKKQSRKFSDYLKYLKESGAVE